MSSLAELRTALRAGADPDDIIFLGPGKSPEEIAACVVAGVHVIVAESFEEIADIDAAARVHDRAQCVPLRGNPTRLPSRARLATGKAAAVRRGRKPLAARHPRTRPSHPRGVVGVHAYLGTRILDPRAVIDNTRYILDLADRVHEATNCPETVGTGGGLGVPYFDNESEIVPDLLTKEVNPPLTAFCAGHPHTRLILEAAPLPHSGACGTYLVAVRSVKRSQGKNFAVTGGGTHQHMATVGIGAVIRRNYPVRLLGRAADPVTVAHTTPAVVRPSRR